jgi:hypothetical protein
MTEGDVPQGQDCSTRPGRPRQPGRVPTLGRLLSTLAVIDFLKPREKAWLIWLLAVVAFAVYKGGRDIGRSTWAVVSAAAHPKVLLLVGIAAVYSAGVVYLASMLGLWHTSATKETVYWFFGTGLAVVGNATGMSPTDPDFVRKLVGRAIRWTIVVEFLVIPVIIVFVALQAYTQYQPTEAAVRKFIDGVLLVIGLALLLYGAVQVLSDPGGFWTREHAEGFLVAPALTVTLVPMLFLVAWYSRRELEAVRGQFRLEA